MISNCDRDGRVASPLREIGALYMHTMIHANFCKEESRLTEALLRAGPAKKVDDDEAPDERVFARDMPSLLRLNVRRRRKIWQDLKKNLMDVVMSNGDWTIGPGEKW